MRLLIETILLMLAITPLLVLGVAWGIYCAPVGMKRIAEPILLLLAAIPVWGIVIAGLVFRLPVAAMLAAFFFGWWNVVFRAAPQVEVNLAGVATGILCGALTIFVLHRFAAWVYREVLSKQQRINWPPAWRWSWTAGVVAAVMLLFVAGLVGVGLFRTTGWLLETTEFVQRKPDFL